MANRAVLTVAAICTATLAQADTFAERWPGPSAVDPVRVAKAPAAEPPKRSGRPLPAIAFISPEQASVLGMQAMRRQCNARPTQTCCLRGNATRDFLAPDILNKCGPRGGQACPYRDIMTAARQGSEDGKAVSANSG